MRTSFIAMLTSLLTLSATAGADDAKILPGIACQAATSTGAPYTSTQASSGRLFNSGTSTAYLNCPVVWDNTLNDLPDSGSFAWVVDQSSATGVTCTLYSAYQTAASVSSWSAAASTPAGLVSNVPQKLLLNGSLGYQDPTAVAAWDYLRCSVPSSNGGSNSGVLSYYVFEQ